MLKALLLSITLSLTASAFNQTFYDNNAIVMVYHNKGHGTGFYISNTEIITARHVCAGLDVKVSDGNTVLFVHESEEKDLCYIKVWASNKHLIYNISNKETKLFNIVCSRGIVQKIPLLVCGKVIGAITVMTYSSVEWVKLFDGRIIPGMSGGPVTNAKGKVVGVNCLTTSTNYSGFVPLRDLKKFIKEARETAKREG